MTFLSSGLAIFDWLIEVCTSINPIGGNHGRLSTVNRWSCCLLIIKIIDSELSEDEC